MTHQNSALNVGANKGRNINTQWRKTFLEKLAETSNVTKSALASQKPIGEVYRLRSRDAEFAQKWSAALLEGYGHLELEVLRRLREGDQKTEDGEKYDFANAIRLLSAHRDNAAQAQAQRRNVSAAEVRTSIDRKVEEIRSRVMAEKAKIRREH